MFALLKSMKEILKRKMKLLCIHIRIHGYKIKHAYNSIFLVNSIQNSLQRKSCSRGLVYLRSCFNLQMENNCSKHLSQAQNSCITLALKLIPLLARVYSTFSASHLFRSRLLFLFSFSSILC